MKLPLPVSGIFLSAHRPVLSLLCAANCDGSGLESRRLPTSCGATQPRAGCRRPRPISLRFRRAARPVQPAPRTLVLTEGGNCQFDHFRFMRFRGGGTDDDRPLSHALVPSVVVSVRQQWLPRISVAGRVVAYCPWHEAADRPKLSVTFPMKNGRF